ncbi:MAG: hypothetical protein ACX93U_00055 [Salipiger thiooxidans]|uniref:hypothetical protein n=1 Tax=Salipiger thiooxidans TaxID=282683 RepID=UPI001CF93C92|nr:hypothetical protein [Salipiger thiooxidans]
MTNEPASGNATGLPTISELYVKALHVNGLCVALAELDPYDTRMRGACASVREAIEVLSQKLADDLERLDSAKEGKA